MPVEILMPELSPTMTEGAVASWLKSVGDAVEAGEVIAEIETDKATVEYRAAANGTLAKILVEAGTEGVAVHQPIALLVEQGERPDAVSARSDMPPPPTRRERPLASPLARKIAAQSGIDLAAVKGSGPNGRIVKRDVVGAVAPVAPPPPRAPAPEPAREEAGEAALAHDPVPHSAVRKVIARRLSEAKRDIPHFYLSIDCRIDALLALRAELNARPGADYRLSVNDFVLRAVATAMRRVPNVNASWTEDAIRVRRGVDVSVAVAIEGGLITPVIRDADRKGLATLSNEARELAARARERKLSPEEYEGGGFTVSNLGMYGIREFAAIINPPQSCILAVGAGEQRPVVTDGALGVATVMTCTLSADHRVVDGAIGAEFLAIFKGLIEDPLSMLL